MTYFIWQNGLMKPYDEAKTHVMTHALHYGTGVFEGIRAYETTGSQTSILGLSPHLDRLFSSSETLAMTIPYTKEELSSAIIELIKVNSFKECYIRPLAYYGKPPTSGVRVMPAADTPVDVILSCYPMGNYLPDEPIHVKISDVIRLHPNSTDVGAKICGHYINSMQALLQIRGTKYGEVIMLDYEGNVSEGSSDNIFVIKNGIVSTPEIGGILKGITRGIIIQLMRDLGYTVVETKIKPDELWRADEAFLVGTAVEVRGVASVDDKNIGNGLEGPITKKIKDEYKKICTGNNPKYNHLLTKVI